MYDGQDIHENAAARKLNILKGFVETEPFFEKGQMDFGGSAAPKGNLNKKTITDKNGHQTTRYVKNGDDEKNAAQPSPKQNEIAQNNPNKSENNADQVEDKPIESHAQETSTEDLEAYIQNNPEGEYVAAAQAELEARNGGASSDPGAEDGGFENGQSEPGQDETSGEMDFSSPEGVAQAMSDPATATAVVQLMTSDPTLTLSHALKMNAATSGGGAETHAHLDAAQAALDAAKAASGHPGANQEGNEEVEVDSQEAAMTAEDVSVAAEELYGITDKSLHIEDLKEILDKYDVVYQGEALPRGSEKELKIILESAGWAIEGGDEDETEDSYNGDEDEHEEEDQWEGMRENNESNDSENSEEKETKNSDNSEGFGGGDTEADDDGTGSKQDEENKKKNPSFGKK